MRSGAPSAAKLTRANAPITINVAIPIRHMGLLRLGCASRFRNPVLILASEGVFSRSAQASGPRAAPVFPDSQLSAGRNKTGCMFPPHLLLAASGFYDALHAVKEMGNHALLRLPFIALAIIVFFIFF